MKKINSILVVGIIGMFITSCDQLNSAYLVNDTPDPIEVMLSITNPEEVESSFIYRKLLGDSTAIIYELGNQTTRIEFSVCSKCEVELFFDTAPLRARYLGADTLKIIKQGEIILFNTKEEIFNAFLEREHYTKKYLTIRN